MPKIVYFDVQDDEKEFLKINNEGKYDYYLLEDSLTDLITLDENLLDANIISVFTTSRITKNILKKFKKLELIALRSVGYNHIDLDYCNDRGIVVENTPNYGNKSVAEFAMGLLLNVCRKITIASTRYKEIGVDTQLFTGYELAGKTIGIVGLGAIGSEFARIVHGFDMKILGFDLFRNEKLVKDYGVVYTDFDKLLSESDFISIHAPLTKDNRHMFNEIAFKKMRNNAILINTARGEHINTQDLYNALQNKEIAGVGLDVLESEETISDADYLVDISRLNETTLMQTILNTRLQQLPNVIITPHIAYNTQEAIHRILSTTMSNVDLFIKGIVQHNVN